MWRSNKFTENEDLDQNISDEEESGSGVGDYCISLGGSTEEKKGELHVLSQLEKLRDARELDHATEPTISFQKRRAGICIQDAAEFPAFNNEGNFVRFTRKLYTGNSDDEIVSDDEKVENAGSSSSNAALLKANISFKGGRGRAKSKFSFHFHPHKDLSLGVNNEDETPSLSHDPSLQEDLEPIQNREAPNSMSELLDLFQGKNVEKSKFDSIPADVAVEHKHPKLSVADLLDSVQENSVLLGVNSTTHSRTKGERAHLAVKRNIYSLGDRKIGDDGSCEAFDSGSSSGDEDERKNIKRTNPESKQKTMTDQFHEAFGISSMNDAALFQFPRQSGIGLFGKLQRILQSEKEKEREFLRRLNTESSLTDENRCIDVRILSRSLEARLIVCCCFFIRDQESSQCLDNSKMGKDMKRNSTVIFSPRTCSDVELEPGKLIRIHPPWYWKEIPIMGKDENIVLSAYFSQRLT